jgi:hypothetical protein
MFRKTFDPKKDCVSGQTWDWMGCIGLIVLSRIIGIYAVLWAGYVIGMGETRILAGKRLENGHIRGQGGGGRKTSSWILGK